MKLPRADSALHCLMTRFPRDGRVLWIGLRRNPDDAVAAEPG